MRRYIAMPFLTLILLASILCRPSFAAQNSCVIPTTGTLSGLTLVQDINACHGSMLSVFSGATAPSPATQWMLWQNTANNTVYQYDGSAWNALWTVDASNHLAAVQIGGGTQVTIASGSITDLWSTPSASISISGTTPITQLANGNAVPGAIKVACFTGALTLTQGGGAGGAPLNLPNGGNSVTTAPGDCMTVQALTSTNVNVVSYQRATGAALSSIGLSLGASGLSASALASYEQPINMQVNASVASGNLTVAIKGVNGGDPSPSNPVLVGFRSQTTGSGTNVFGQIASPLSFTVAAANSMGCATGAPCRLWGELICQTESAGTCTSILVGLSVQSGTVSGNLVCQPLVEDMLQLTGAGTSGGGSLGTIYTSVASLSNKAIRIVFFVEATWTSGSSGWTTLSKVQLFGPGVKKPCDIVQTVQSNLVGAAQVTSNGSGVVTNVAGTITPTSAINFIYYDVRVDWQSNAAANVLTNVTMNLQRGATTLPAKQIHRYSCSTTAAEGWTFALQGLDQPLTTSATTYAAVVTNGPSCQVVVPGNNGVGSVMLQEIMGALERANEDALLSEPG